MELQRDLLTSKVKHMRMLTVMDFIIKHDNYRRLSNGTRFALQASFGGYTNGQDNKFIKAYWVLLQLTDGEKLDLANEDLITIEQHNDIIRRFDAIVSKNKKR